MFEVLVYMFENYIDTQFRPDDSTLSRELSAAGFDEEDINGAFDWFNLLESSAQKPELFHQARALTSAFLPNRNSAKSPEKAWASFNFW